jgi:hypothetical protein
MSLRVCGKTTYNKALQPTATPPLRSGSASAEFGRWASQSNGICFS